MRKGGELLNKRQELETLTELQEVWTKNDFEGLCCLLIGNSIPTKKLNLSGENVKDKKCDDNDDSVEEKKT